MYMSQANWSTMCMLNSKVIYSWVDNSKLSVVDSNPISKKKKEKKSHGTSKKNISEV